MRKTRRHYKTVIQKVINKCVFNCDLNYVVVKRKKKKYNRVLKEFEEIKDTIEMVESKLIEQANAIAKAQNFLCIACEKRNRCVLFTPCYHMLYCLECVRYMIDKNLNNLETCHFCTKKIRTKKVVQFP